VLAVAHALTQEIGRPRVAVGDRVDVHGVSESRFAPTPDESPRRIHGYIPGFHKPAGPQKTSIPTGVADVTPRFQPGNFGLAVVFDDSLKRRRASTMAGSEPRKVAERTVALRTVRDAERAIGSRH
jgi:hypothetical protein